LRFVFARFGADRQRRNAGGDQTWIAIFTIRCPACIVHDFDHVGERTSMDIRQILDELRAERGRIDSAIAALESVGGKSGNGRRSVTGKRRRRKMSAEGRKRISQAMKRRWAERRKKSAA